MNIFKQIWINSTINRDLYRKQRYVRGQMIGCNRTNISGMSEYVDMLDIYLELDMQIMTNLGYSVEILFKEWE